MLELIRADFGIALFVLDHMYIRIGNILPMQRKTGNIGVMPRESGLALTVQPWKAGKRLFGGGRMI